MAERPLDLCERMEGARVIRVIEVTFVRGLGTEGSPVRQVKNYYTESGLFLAEYDAWAGKANP